MRRQAYKSSYKERRRSHRNYRSLTHDRRMEGRRVLRQAYKAIRQKSSGWVAVAPPELERLRLNLIPEITPIQPSLQRAVDLFWGSEELERAAELATSLACAP